MKLHRVVLNWSGQPITGLAVTVLHYDGTNQTAPPVASINSAVLAMRSLLPNTVAITIPNSGDTIQDTTGALDGVWTGSGGTTITGSGTPGVAAGVGGCIGWTTSTIVSGTKGPRKLRGRTFVVPVAVQHYDQDGTFIPASLTTLQQFAIALQASGPLAIWHRPSGPGLSNGSSGPVVSSKVRDKVAYLSSRRD